ncbi:MAG TPA: LysR family transcriptional regulator [Solirubrobacteraceae bacterium]|nr:LysR family transcriptional regulator [Solirubrobacteraceae bacterium]
MTLQQLACFCLTAQEGSFSAAARRMRLSQPSVSDQVRRLEAELGATLVVSTGRGVRLTADGQTFLVHAERVIADADEASNCIGHRTERGSRVVGLGLTRNAPYYPIDEFVSRAVAQIPDLQLRLPGQNSALVAAAVRDGDLEAALVILPVDPEGLDVRPLFSDEVLLVSADLGRTRRRARIDDLAKVPLILYDTTAGFADPTRRQLAARAQAAGVSLIPRFEVEHPETAFQLAAKGFGDTIAARAVTRSPGFPAGLSTVGFAEPLFDSFALITRPGAVPPVVQALTDILEEWGADLAEKLNP